MKKQKAHIIKYFSVIIIFSLVSFSSFGQYRSTDHIAMNSSDSNVKSTIDVNNQEDLKSSSDVIEEKEESIFDSSLINIINSVDAEMLIDEELMNSNLNQDSCMCIDIYTDFKEKEWMKKHTFFIL